MGLFFALAAAVLFAVSNIFARKGLEQHDIDSYQGVLINLTIVNLVNLPVFIVYVMSSSLPEFNWYAVGFFTAAGFLNTFLGRMLLFSSIETIGPSRAGTFKIISPAVVVLIGVFVLGERLSVSAWTGISTILLGVFLVSLETRARGARLTTSNFRVQNSAEDDNAYYKRGVLFGLLSGVSFGSGNIFRKAGVTLYPGFIVGVVISSLFALLCSWVYTIFKGEGREAALALKKYWKGPYFWTGLFTSLALFSLFLALQLAPVTIVNSIAASEPLFTMLVSVLILGRSERLRLSTAFRSMVIVAGLIILFVFN